MSNYWELGSGRPHSLDDRYDMSGVRMQISSAPRVRHRSRRNVRTYSRRGPQRSRRRITYAQRGYVRTTGFYGRFTSGGERKFKNTVVDDAAIAATLTINNLTVIAEGNGESERVGRKLTVTKISVLYSMQLPGSTTAAASSDTVRCMLIQDKQTNGAQFVATDLIDLDNFNEFNNLANSKDLKSFTNLNSI